MRGALLALLVFSILGGLPAAAQRARLPAPSFPLTASLDASGVPLLAWSCPERQAPRQRVMLRSTTDLRTTKDGLAFPIAHLDANRFSKAYLDTEAPHDVGLSYQLKLVFADGRTVYSSVAFITLPPAKLSRLQKPSIFVDKTGYTLTLLDEGQPVRRFPIALGANPVNRKIHLDRASTPEGVYRISGVQPRATFHRAYDLNYPNEVDRIRYRVLADRGDLPNPLPDIGGEIQIHGHGITGNWTWGCIALRDTDMDLLFSLPELRNGTVVVITGTEVTRDDLDVQRSLTEEERHVFMEHLVELGIASGRTSKHWLYGLCKFQAEHGLMMTGLFDRSTRELLERTGALSKTAR
jgi:hypothetical protein